MTPTEILLIWIIVYPIVLLFSEYYRTKNNEGCFNWYLDTTYLPPRILMMVFWPIPGAIYSIIYSVKLFFFIPHKLGKRARRK